ncbi:phosphatase PAP2 family protein [Haloechinothrix sp. LS1_15]|nr:phosphatase PAP2 family protein [Haloechinothrix sp. LS1_15]
MLSDGPAIVLAGAFVLMTVLAAGPLHFVDTFFNEFPRPEISRATWLFLDYGPDEIASRFVAIPALGIVALYLAHRFRSWRPLILGAAGVVGMSGLVWGLKLLLARHHPKTFDPTYFSDGEGIAFPSGHGANAIMFYGLIVYLLMRYKLIAQPLVRKLIYGIVAIAVVQTAVSVFMQFHWFTDLVAGMIAGGLTLRLVIVLDRTVPPGRTRSWWPWREGAAAQQRRPSPAVAGDDRIRPVPSPAPRADAGDGVRAAMARRQVLTYPVRWGESMVGSFRDRATRNGAPVSTNGVYRGSRSRERD